MSSNEAQVVGLIGKEILRRFPTAWVFKVVGSPYQMVGVPDLLVVIDGLLFGLEVKHQKPHETKVAARRRTTAGQRYQISRINRAGGVATTVLTPYEAVRVIAWGLRERGRRRS